MTDPLRIQKLLPNEGVYGLDVVFPDTLDIDESRMSVIIPFADGQRRDGVGDLLEVGGIRTERHRKNPIALFDHGKHYHLPVALCEDPETGAYSVFLDPVAKVASAKMFFYQGKGGALVGEQKDAHCLFCEQLFHLICHKFIRSGSIGYRIIKAYDLPPDYERGLAKGQHLIETELLEASVVTLPANQDTVRKALALPQVCGKPLSPYLRKCLELQAGQKSTVSVPLRDVRHRGKVPPAKWKPGLGAVKQQGMRADELTYRSLETADSPMGEPEMNKSQPSSGISPEKARQILHDGEVRGHKLTKKQRGMFGAAASKGQKAPPPQELNAAATERQEREHRLKLLRDLYGQKALDEDKVPSAESVKPKLKAGHRIKPLLRQSTKKRPAHLPTPLPSAGAKPPGGGHGSLPVKAFDDEEKESKDIDLQTEDEGLEQEETPADQSQPTFEEQGEGPEQAPGSFPPSESTTPKYSLQVLQRMKEDALLLIEDYDEMRGPLEHPEIDAHLVRKLQALVTEVEEIEGMEEQHHPEMGGAGLRDKYAQGAEAPSEAIAEEGDLEAEEAETDKDSAEADEMQLEETDELPDESDGDEEPTPEEAVEGMRNDPRKKNKALTNGRTKALCPKCGKEHKGTTMCKDGTGMEGAAPENEAPQMKSAHPLQSHQPHISEAHGFLHEVAHSTEWSDEHRMKAYHYHKLLDDSGRLLEANAGTPSHAMTPGKDFEAVEHADETAHVQHPHTQMLQEASTYLHELSGSHGPLPEERAKALLHWNTMGSLVNELSEAAIQHPDSGSEYTPGDEPMQQLKASFSNDHKALQGIREKLTNLTKLFS